MAPNQLNTIYPCPFSKGYGIPVEQAWSLLKVFFVSRFIISSVFATLYFTPLGVNLLKIQHSDAYGLSSISYWFLVLLSGFIILWRPISYTSQAQISIFTDIIFITLLMHAAGGVSSGIGILLAGTIAAGGLLIGGRCALLFAALASLSVLSEQIYTAQNYTLNNTSFSYAGMLGAAFFAIAYLSYVLAKRAEQSEILASQHQKTISNLEELNQYIIQHLQSGIIISNADSQVKMCNESVLTLTDDKNTLLAPAVLSDISPQLKESFQLWLEQPNEDFALIRLPNNKEIHARFSLIDTHQEIFHMIILEDISLYNQRLQQSKLASLGRLTASISHEIRNPLGAISHAGQLLSEAPSLSPQDKRLTEIIQSHCHRVNTIIENVLQLSRRTPSKREKINLTNWIPSYLDDFIQSDDCSPDSFFIKKQSTALWVYIDAGHLKQIMDNLCTNALKYGNTSKYRITIEVSMRNHSPCIRILDNGGKMDDATINHLFEPFFTTSTSGTGLGLYISKELAELNQATLSYSPTADENCFKLCFPNADSSKIEI